MPVHVSVVLCFLNEERFVAEAIESVLGQRYSDWEMILVDDGSSDRSTEIARGYAMHNEGRIQYIDHPGHVNRGLSPSRNVGMKAARGKYVAFLDADDVWSPQKLAEQVELLEAHPQAAGIYGALRYWKSWETGAEGDDEISYPDVGKDSLVAPPRLLLECYPLGKGTPPAPSDLMVRRDVAWRIGGFEEGFVAPYHLYEDQAFLAKLYLQESIYVAGECWTKYRLRPESICATSSSPDVYRKVQLYFYQFLKGYLRQTGNDTAEIWTAVRRAERRARHPRLWWALGRLTGLFHVARRI